jgi:hypothetical protein
MPIYPVPEPPLETPRSDADVRAVPPSVSSYADHVCRNPAPLPKAVYDHPTSSPKAELLLAFSRAAGKVDVGAWDSYFKTAKKTVFAHPLDFGWAMVKGFGKVLLDEITDLVSVIEDLTVTVARAWECLGGAEVGGLTLERIATADTCVPIRDLVRLLVALREVDLALKKLAVEAIHNPSSLLDLFSLLASFNGLAMEIVADILDHLTDADAELRRWILSLVQDATRLGSIYGYILGNVAATIGTGGSNRGAKAARAARNIIPQLSDAETAVTWASNIADELQAFNALHQGDDAALLRLLYPKLMRSLARAEGNLSRHITKAKLDEVYNAVKNLVRLDPFPDAIERLSARVAENARRRRLHIAPHRDNKRLAYTHNDSAVTLAFMTAAQRVDTGEAVDAYQASFGLAMEVFDSHHVIEKRLLGFSELLKKDFALLGWNHVDDMTAILLTNAEHNRSIVNALRKVNQATPENLASVADVDSVSKVLQKKIVVQGDRADDALLIITNKTTGREVIAAYEQVYHERFRDLYEALKDHFADWQQKLGETGR